MEILFLGTSSMVPTKERNHSGILIRYKSETILVDCGEGIQRQMKIAGAKLARITKILISHWHGDHVLGIPGLMQSMNASGYNGKLQIYGPVGTRRFVKKMLDVFAFDNKIAFGVNEIKDGKFFQNGDFVLEAKELKHNVPTLGYSLAEKDRRKINIKYIKKIGIPIGPLLGELQKGKSIVWKDKKVDIQRYKGLGEMNPSELWSTTMDSSVRTLKQVTIEDAGEADRIFDILLGQEVKARRKFIQTHSRQVMNLDT